MEVRESFLGIPVDKTHRLTGYRDAQEWLSSLLGDGVQNPAVVYRNWSVPDIERRPALSGLVSGKLGGQKDLLSLLDSCREQGIADVFLDLDLTVYEKGGAFFSKKGNCAKLLSMLPATVRDYSLGTGVEITDNPGAICPP